MPGPSRTRHGQGRRSQALPLSILEGLQQIANNTQGNSALLGSLLSAIKAHQEMEIILVRDTGNSDVIVAQINEYDEETDTWSTSYQNPDGTAYTITGPLEYMDASAVLNLILTELLDQGTGIDSLVTDIAAMLSDTDILSTPEGNVAKSILRVTTPGLGNITAGKRRVTFYNASKPDVNVDGQVLKRGEVVTFVADGIRDTLPAFTYDALTGELLITTVG